MFPPLQGLCKEVNVPSPSSAGPKLAMIPHRPQAPGSTAAPRLPSCTLCSAAGGGATAAPGAGYLGYGAVPGGGRGGSCIFIRANRTDI